MVNTALKSVVFNRLQKHAALVHAAIAALHAAAAHSLRHLTDSPHHIGKIMNGRPLQHGLHVNRYFLQSLRIMP